MSTRQNRLMTNGETKNSLKIKHFLLVTGPSSGGIQNDVNCLLVTGGNAAVRQCSNQSPTMTQRKPLNSGLEMTQQSRACSGENDTRACMFALPSHDDTRIVISCVSPKYWWNHL
ncbi:hypothetical protein CEXT_176861 [Caerostris extrusa]|uniref:Uncharacterized protein n=1 Tax=Caerostris extrusa TaxID=172846 RepID=A0AAV4XTL8_CAEEX|nr:hypothetical protein CEXT_176861 [Caerostris extrusa]